MNTRVSLSVLALAASLCTSAAFATTIPLGTTTTASYGTTVVASVPTGTTSPAPTPGDTTPFVVSYSETVYRGGSGAMCASCLNFVFNFSNIATSGNDAILEMSIANFDSATIATDYIPSASATSIAPTQAVETSNAVVNFGYDGPTGVLPGDSSDTLVIFTNETAYTAGTQTFQDGVVAIDPALVPTSTAVTPEPSSLAMLGTGLVGVAGLIRRRFQA